MPIIENIESDELISLKHSADGLEQIGPSITTSFVDRSSHAEEKPKKQLVESLEVSKGRNKLL